MKGPLAAAVSTSALLVCFSLGLPKATAQRPQEVEARIVDYLKEHVKPGEPLLVSDLYNNVFKTDEERKVLNRLFNTFFKIPLFVAQYKAGTGQAPTLADISRQFNFPVEGEASVLLSIIDNDPRIPKFIRRDPASGEITSVDIEAVKKDRRFGQVLERTLMGWVGKDAPPFAFELVRGGKLDSAELRGKSYLLYFWFSGCPPCVKIAPHLAELYRRFGGKEFTVVAVNADRFLELEVTDAERAEYLRKAGIAFPVGHLTKKMQEDYGNVNVFPTLFLVDARGVVQKHYVNYQTLDVLRGDIEALLRKGSAAQNQEPVRVFQGVARMGLARRDRGARRKAMSVRIVDDEQRRYRPQSPCARRVPAARAHLRCWRASTMHTDIACGAPPSICARGARNAAPSNTRTGSPARCS